MLHRTHWAKNSAVPCGVSVSIDVESVCSCGSVRLADERGQYWQYGYNTDSTWATLPCEDYITEDHFSGVTHHNSRSVATTTDTTDSLRTSFEVFKNLYGMSVQVDETAKSKKESTVRPEKKLYKQP